MARVIVDVMLKPEILDPQGQAVMGALARHDVHSVTSVRQGKRFELELPGEVDEATLAELDRISAELLSNPVIEDYTLRVEDD